MIFWSSVLQWICLTYIEICVLECRVCKVGALEFVFVWSFCIGIRGWKVADAAVGHEHSRVTWLVHIRDTTHAYMFRCVIWLSWRGTSCTSGVLGLSLSTLLLLLLLIRINVWHDSFMYVTRHMYVSSDAWHALNQQEPRENLVYRDSAYKCCCSYIYIIIYIYMYMYIYIYVYVYVYIYIYVYIYSFIFM